jgi:F-box-like
MNLLPSEIICDILLKLSNVDLYAALLMCQSWSSSDYFWKKKCHSDSWRGAYKTLCQYFSVVTSTKQLMTELLEARDIFQQDVDQLQARMQPNPAFNPLADLNNNLVNQHFDNFDLNDDPDISSDEADFYARATARNRDVYIRKA